MTARCLACAFILCTASLLFAQDLDADLPKFQGKWTPTKLFMDNQFLPQAVLSKINVTMKGHTMTVCIEDVVLGKSTNTYNATKSPRTFEYIEPGGKRKGERVFGIYDLDGNNLRICIGDYNERPKDFSFPKKKSRRIVMFLKRAD